MTRVAFSGHRGLAADAVPEIDRALRDVLAAHSPRDLVGVSCLADGADRLFARAVLDAGGRLVAVTVATEHCQFAVGQGSPYAELLSQAYEIRTVPPTGTVAGSWRAASRELLRDADLLVAVWDGRRPNGRGSTADVAGEARRRGIPVTVVWPQSG